MRLHPIASAAHFPTPLLAGCLLITALAGCGAEPGTRVVATPTGTDAAEVPGSAAQVERRIGTTTVYAYAMQTSAIPEAVAREHGIDRAPERIMLRVSGRSGAGDDVTSVPLQVAVRVTDLQGRAQEASVKETVVNGLVDYVATFTTSLPDTLRFDVTVTTPEGTSETLQLTRDFSRP